MIADLDHRGGAAAVAAVAEIAFDGVAGEGRVGDARRDVAAAADLPDQRQDRGEIGAVLRRLGAALAGEAVDRPVLLVEDHDPVVMEALGHEHADLEVEPGRDRRWCRGSWSPPRPTRRRCAARKASGSAAH